MNLLSLLIIVGAILGILLPFMVYRIAENTNKINRQLSTIIKLLGKQEGDIERETETIDTGKKVRICPNCGAKNRIEDWECINCGKTL